MHCFCHRRDCGVAETAAKDWNRACSCVGHGLLATLVAAGGLDGALHFLARSRRTHAVPADERSGTLQAASERTPQGEPVHPTMLPGTATERQRSRRAHSRTKESHLRGWLGRQNVGRGIAPVSSVLLEEAEGLQGVGRRGAGGCAFAKESVAMAPTLAAPLVRPRRSRPGGGPAFPGRLRAQGDRGAGLWERTPLRRAPRCVGRRFPGGSGRPVRSLPAEFWGAVLGPLDGPQNGAGCSSHMKDWVQKTAPFWAPVLGQNAPRRRRLCRFGATFARAGGGRPQAPAPALRRDGHSVLRGGTPRPLVGESGTPGTDTSIPHEASGQA